MGRLARWRHSLRIARQGWLSRFVFRKVEWIQRSAVAPPAPNDLVVVCLVRDSEARVSAFLDYYLGLGARHVVLVDNASTDRTIAKACEFDGRVSVLSCKLDYKRYQVPIKLWLTSRFGREGWCLVADIDEYFDYPQSGKIDLGSFLGYMNAREYTGVVCQMVDLFSDRPLAEWPESGEGLRSQCLWYDHSMVTLARTPRYSKRYRVSTTQISPRIGGIKRSAFGVDRLLTKHVLIRPSSGARLNGPHYSRGARIADVSAALLHYPFDRGFRQRCEEAVRMGQYWQDSREYRMMLGVLESHGPEWRLHLPTATKLTSVDQLVDEGFLAASAEYFEFVESSSRPVA
jgi:hypothetical protein